MNNENAVLYAQTTKGCDILRVLYGVIKKQNTLDFSPVTQLPTIEHNGSHIDIGYNGSYQNTATPLSIWIGINLHVYKSCTIQIYLGTKDIKLFPDGEGTYYGQKETETKCSQIWIPLKKEHCDEVFDSETSDAKRKEILSGYLDEVLAQFKLVY
ncbi:hypothetical protein FACS1894109_05740 [Spirochaetia bacterium]|nr:hypothetical protein FACS1894109_05740 [Spirochaetia bacterium]